MSEIHDFNSQDEENIEALARVSFDSLDVNRTGKITKNYNYE